MSHEHPVWELLDKLQMDVRQINARMTELRSQVAALNLAQPDRFVCPDPLCRLDLRSEAKLAEHLYHSHDGPVPDHWLAIEARAADPKTPADDDDEQVAA